MGSTTVHIPDDLLKRVDTIAQRRGVSRNRVVVASLEAEIGRDGGEWPDEFFTPPSEDERLKVAEALEELESTVTAGRRSRGR
ncbi:MAG: ribbon-helix-helix protein, CopG family [Alkalispirochaeta sp.]